MRSLAFTASSRPRAKPRIGLAPGITAVQGALDFLLCNVLVIDPVIGIVKGDLGIKDGRIVALDKAGMFAP